MKCKWRTYGLYPDERSAKGMTLVSLCQHPQWATGLGFDPNENPFRIEGCYVCEDCEFFAIEKEEDKEVNMIIQQKYDVDRIKKICKEMIKEEKGKTLAVELMNQTVDNAYTRFVLNKATEARLLKWANPKRIDSRSKFVTPRAREICQILFGGIPRR